jgi:hypothetical protein
MRVLASSRRSLACVLIGAFSLAAAPARAADARAAVTRPATLAGSAEVVVARMQAAPTAAMQESAPANVSSDGFLKGRRGRIAAALFVTGIVVTVVSRKKDAVHSPARGGNQ